MNKYTLFTLMAGLFLIHTTNIVPMLSSHSRFIAQRVVRANLGLKKMATQTPLLGSKLPVIFQETKNKRSYSFFDAAFNFAAYTFVAYTFLTQW